MQGKVSQGLAEINLSCWCDGIGELEYKSSAIMEGTAAQDKRLVNSMAKIRWQNGTERFWEYECIRQSRCNCPNKLYTCTAVILTRIYLCFLLVGASRHIAHHHQWHRERHAQQRMKLKRSKHVFEYRVWGIWEICSMTRLRSSLNSLSLISRLFFYVIICDVQIIPGN